MIYRMGLYFNKEVVKMFTEVSKIPKRFFYNVDACSEEFGRLRELEDRRLYLYGEIASVDYEDKCLYLSVSMVSKLVENILDFNRADEGIPPEDRKSVRLYISSPGGEVTGGFVVGSAGKAHDRAKFNEDFKNKVMKPHVLAHGKMPEAQYDAIERVEFYMLPELASIFTARKKSDIMGNSYE